MGDLLHSFKEITAQIGRPGLGTRRVEPPAILELQLCVEPKEIRRAGRVIGAGDGLSLVMQIVKAKALLRRQLLHVLETVCRVALRVIRTDRPHADAEI